MQTEERRKAKQEYYQNNKEKYIKKQLERYNRLSTIFKEWRSGLCCCFCGEDETVCLDFHHVDMQEKEQNIPRMVTQGYNNLSKELKKCVVLCANCHRKVHADLITIKIDKDLSESFKEFHDSKES